jgi:hypothetical protein
MVSPCPKAARIRARLVMLFEPGTVTTAEGTREGGMISMRSGRGMMKVRRGYSGEVETF